MQWTLGYIFKLMFLFSFFFCLFRPHLRHMDVPRLGVKSELQLPAYTTATATSDLSFIFNLHYNSQQCQIFNPLTESRKWTRNLMVTSRIHFHFAARTSEFKILMILFIFFTFYSHTLSKLHSICKPSFCFKGEWY